MRCRIWGYLDTHGWCTLLCSVFLWVFKYVKNLWCPLGHHNNLENETYTIHISRVETHASNFESGSGNANTNLHQR